MNWMKIKAREGSWLRRNGDKTEEARGPVYFLLQTPYRQGTTGQVVTLGSLVPLDGYSGVAIGVPCIVCTPVKNKWDVCLPASSEDAGHCIWEPVERGRGHAVSALSTGHGV